VRIRRGRPEEAPALSALALRSKTVWGYDPEFLELYRPALELDAGYLRSNQVLVAEVAGSPAAFLTLRERGRELEIEFLFVEPASMGSGMGRALVEEALGIAADRGCARVVVESDPNAEGFYLRLGARRIATVESTVVPGHMRPVLEFRLTGSGADGSSGSEP
jgi:GNAT superfamily N-acetyltransferase